MAWRTFTDAPSTAFRSTRNLTAFRAALVAGQDSGAGSA